MGEPIIWLDGVANVGIEKICPRRHVRQNEWQAAWNEDYLGNGNVNKYDYISDYECIFNHPINHQGNDDLQDDPQRWQNLQAAKRQIGTNVLIMDLAHFTSLENAQQIAKYGSFKGGHKKIDEDDGNPVTANLSWWSPIFTNEDKEQVRNTVGNAIQPFLGEEALEAQFALKAQFATSDAFHPNPNRYGNHFFQYGIEELCEYYSQYVGDELQYKILGTFGYKQEVMHAVLVCSQVDGAGQFAGYPDVKNKEEDVNNEAVITRDGEGKWVWKPQATATEIIRLEAHLQNFPRYRRWEHVAFAFHIPEMDGMINAGIPADHWKVIPDAPPSYDEDEDEDEED